MFTPIHTSSVRTSLPPREGQLRKLLRDLGNDEYLLEMDWSSIESFTTCDRSSEWKLIHSRIGKSKYALIYGGAIHKALESYYHALREKRVPDISAIISEGEKTFTENPPDLYEWRDFERFSETIKLYEKTYKDEPAWRIEYIEQPFAVPLALLSINQQSAYPKRLLVADSNSDDTFYIKTIHISWTGVIDLVIDEAGSPTIVDHKTTSIEGEGFWRAFNLSQQFLGYVWAAREITGLNIRTAIPNAIIGRKPTKTGKGVQLERQHKFYKLSHIEEWKENMKTILEDFIHHLMIAKFPMRTQWCENKFGPCPYVDVCSMEPHLRLTMLHSNQYQSNVWNPLD